MAKTPSQEELAKALSAAATAHHEYELKVFKGIRDAQWSGFYAAYTLGRVGDFTTPSSFSRWLGRTVRPSSGVLRYHGFREPVRVPARRFRQHERRTQRPRAAGQSLRSGVL